MGRIESGAELFEFQVLPLEPLVLHCLERHRARAEAKRQVLEAIPVGVVSGGVVSGEWYEASRPSANSEAIPNDRPGNAPDHSPRTTHHAPVSDHAPRTTHHSPVSVWADEEAVSQILENLVDNALKYTPPGGHI